MPEKKKRRAKQLISVRREAPVSWGQMQAALRRAVKGAEELDESLKSVFDLSESDESLRLR